MADVAALYGLFGAVGGALLGAGATVAAPMLLNRRTRRERGFLEQRLSFSGSWCCASARVRRS